MRSATNSLSGEMCSVKLWTLGQFATPEAVEKLIVAAQPERGLFRKKPLGLRIAAIQALGAAGTPPALDALVTLQADRERDVQQAAVNALEEKVSPRAISPSDPSLP